MEGKNKIKQLEKTMEELGAAADFETAAARFDAAGKLVRELLTDGKTAEGKIYEVIKETDKYIEVESAVRN